MRPTPTAICGAAFSALLIIAPVPCEAAEDLGDILRESGWDSVIGTWVDEDTKGVVLKVTYAWRFENTVIEVTVKEQDKETVALIGVNAESGEVFHMAADSQGGSSLGKWELKDGDAVLGVMFTSGEGQQGGLRIRHHLEDDDTLLLTVELPQPFTVKLIRVKE